jgi:hypothetical protein
MVDPTGRDPLSVWAWSSVIDLRWRPLLTVVLLLITLSRCDLETDEDFVLGHTVLDPNVAFIQSERWTADGREIVYLTRHDYPYDGPPMHIKAVGIETRTSRTLLPAHATASAYHLQSVDPYIYFVREQGLHRLRVSDGAPSTLGLPVDGPYAVSASNEWVVWANSAYIHRANLVTGTRDSLSAGTYWVRHPFVVSPDGAGIVFADRGGWPSDLVWLDLDTRLEVIHPAPCLLDEGSTIHWDGATPILYAACDLFLIGQTAGAELRFVREVFGGSSDVLISIRGADTGAWSPSLERVSAWRRRCPDRRGPGCPGATRELMIADIGGAPRIVGQIAVAAQDILLMDTGPAIFSPTDEHVFFQLYAGSPHDGLRVARIE